MKMKMTRMISLALAAVLVLSLLPVGALTANAAEKSTTYVAFGDSASGGYGADGRFYGNYATILADQKGYQLTEDTLLLGFTSWHRDRLESNDETRLAVEQAGLVTVMLGVDEMMQVVYQAMADRYNASQENQIFASEVPDIINGRGHYEKNVKMQLMLNAMPLLNKGGTYYLVDSQLFKDAIRKFSDDLLAIAKEIKSLNPDVTFLVATQYNPFAEYNGAKITLTLGNASFPYDLTSLYQCMEDGVAVLNDEIKKNASAGGYQVVDVKAAFEKEHSADNDLYVASPGESLATLNWDILPTEAGKQVVAAAFAEKTPDAPKYYNISFDGNGGAGAMTGLVLEEKQSFTLPANGFVAPAGYEFAGWAYAKDGTVINKTAIAVDKDITLYAIWKVQKLEGTVTISGTMQVGSKLTASLSGTNNTGDLTYQWYRGDAPVTTGETYTLTAADVGSTLSCAVTSSVQTGTLKSEATTPVQPQVFADGEIDFQDYKGTYDGKAHTFTVKIPANTTIEYSVDGTTFVAEKPEFTKAGTYTVSCKVTKSGFAAVTGTVQVVIERKAVTVTADAHSMAYGDAEPKLTYKAEGLVGSEKLNGDLARDAGSNVGVYAIKQGTVTNENNPNYNITFVGAALTIGKKAPAYTVPTGLTAVYGQILSEIALPAGFRWQNPRAYVGDVGTNTFAVLYVPEDTVNYEGAVLYVDVKVIEAPNTVRVDFDSKLGTVTGAGAYEDGATVKLTATPTAGGVFEYWVDASVDLTGKLSEAELKAKIISTEATYTFTAADNVHLQAVFSPKTIEIVPMLITGTDAKALQGAKRMNTTLDFGGITREQCPIKLSAQNEIKKEFTVGEKQYKFAGIIVTGYDAQTNARTMELKPELVLELQPLYGSAEYWKWLEPVSGGIYAAYMENTSVTGSGNSKNPATGDNSDMVMWLVILVFCVGAVAVLMVIDRKKQKK